MRRPGCRVRRRGAGSGQLCAGLPRAAAARDGRGSVGLCGQGGLSLRAWVCAGQDGGCGLGRGRGGTPGPAWAFPSRPGGATAPWWEPGGRSTFWRRGVVPGGRRGFGGGEGTSAGGLLGAPVRALPRFGAWPSDPSQPPAGQGRDGELLGDGATKGRARGLRRPGLAGVGRHLWGARRSIPARVEVIPRPGGGAWARRPLGSAARHGCGSLF